jgi:NAD(P)H dehydrogenase (quinone)
MSLVVTGATGHLGRLVVESLLRRGVPAGEIVATGRSIEKLADLAERGVVVRRADYSDPASLEDAFDGADTLLLVSGSEVGQRLSQHVTAIEAAKSAGVTLLAYTSVLRADTSTLSLAAEHKATEEALAASGVPFVLLRNGWYIENYTSQLPTYLEHGVAGAAGEGRVSAATRADYAEATAAVLTSDEPQAGKVYELGGTAFTLSELAAVVSEVTGKDVAYADLPEETFAAVLGQAGLPEPVAQMVAGLDTALKNGELYTDSTDLQDLIGRPSTPVSEAVRAAL